MKKYLWIFLSLVIIAVICFFAFKDNDDKGEYTAQKTSISNSIGEEIKNITNEIIEPKEEKLSEFTTRLPNDTEARDDNIKLACEVLSGNIVKSGETFSLWEILGCPTKERGYEKAKSFTSDGKVIQSYGGGICQVSTTIYNAVLKVDGLKVVERHKHSREVPYIEKGKDAAVSYGNTDLKFKNTLDYDVKINAEVENRKLKIELFRI